jgi:hypothetical protein
MQFLSRDDPAGALAAFRYAWRARGLSIDNIDLLLGLGRVGSQIAHPYLLETEDQLTSYISSARPGFPVERVRACVRRWILYYARQEVGISQDLKGESFRYRGWTVKGYESEKGKESERWGIWMMVRAKAVTIGQFHKASRQRDEANVRRKASEEVRKGRRPKHAQLVVR